jgi:hypothetical protein
MRDLVLLLSFLAFTGYNTGQSVICHTCWHTQTLHTVVVVEQLASMPPILTQVARSSDALPLVATSTPTHTFVLTPKHQQDAKQLLRSMTAR